MDVRMGVLWGRAYRLNSFLYLLSRRQCLGDTHNFSWTCRRDRKYRKVGDTVKSKPSNTAPWIAFYGEDFYRSTNGWTLLERGAYMFLLWESWVCDGLNPDPQRIFRSDPDLEALWPLLESKFPIAEDGRRRNPRLEEIRSTMINMSNKKSTAGRSGASNRWQNDATAIRLPLAERWQNDGSVSVPVPVPVPVSEPLPQPEPNQPTDSLEPRTKRARRQVVGITWDADSGWQNVTDSHLTRWRDAFPAVDIDHQLKKMNSWLIDNPKKAHKSNWSAFMNRWLSREQDRGGNLPSNIVQRPTESNF